MPPMPGGGGKEAVRGWAGGRRGGGTTSRALGEPENPSPSVERYQQKTNIWPATTDCNLIGPIIYASSYTRT